jgi:hypothetical protein
LLDWFHGVNDSFLILNLYSRFEIIMLKLSRDPSRINKRIVLSTGHKDWILFFLRKQCIRVYRF